MDMTVEDFREVAGPLGGLSVEYSIKVSTMLPEYRGASRRDLAPTTFTVSKTFREIEMFFQKVKSKHPNVKLTLCVHDSLFAEDKDERRKVANEFFKGVAQDSTISVSQLLFNFLGYQPAKEIEVRPAKQMIVSKSDDEVDIFDDFLATKAEKELKKPIKESSQNMFTVESDNDDDADYLFGDGKWRNSQKSQTLFAKTPLSKNIKSQPLFDQPDLGGPLQKHEAKFFVPPEALLDDTDEVAAGTESELNEIEDITELLKIDDSLSDIFGQIQHKSKSVPSAPATNDVPSSSSTPPLTAKPKPPLPPKPTAPQTTPRPVVVTATDDDKRLPTPSPRPAVTARPVPPPRTTVPAKPISTVNASPTNSSPAKPARRTLPSDLTRPSPTPVSQSPAPGTDMSDVDILSYIRSEQEASLDQSMDLF